MSTSPSRLLDRLATENWPFAVKFIVPVLLVALLLVAIEAMFIGMVGNLDSTLRDIVNNKYDNSLFLTQSVDKLRSADNDLHIMQIKKAANLPQQAGQETAAIASDLDQVYRTLSVRKSEYSDPVHSGKIDKALTSINNYRDAVNFVGAMLEIDFNATVNFILPLSAVYNKTIADLTLISDEYLLFSKEESQKLVDRASIHIHLLYIFNVVVFLITILVSVKIIGTTVRSVKSLAVATQRLAEGDTGLDLESLERRDELGDVVKSLTIFRDNIKHVDKLKAAQKQAEIIAQAKNMFVANMSHELRSPLNGVLGCSSILKGTALNNKQSECVGIIEDSARSLLEIINDILDYSKIEANKVVLDNDPFDLAGAIRGQVHLMLPLALQKNLSLQVYIDDRIPHYVLGDEGHVRQILVNLIGNALKFTLSGVIFVMAERVSWPEAVPVVIKVTVQDTGIGIAKEAQARLFEPFYQVSSGTMKTMPGTGLGLAIAKRFCTMMHGDMGFESAKGKGSSFWFTLCLQLPSESQIAATIAKEKNSDPLPAFGAKHVLVAEDVATNQFVIQNLLDDIGCSCDLAANGEIARQMAQEKVYDAILMDCHMPVMDGYEAAARIRREERRKIPIIALTAIAAEEDRKKCFAAGMDDFIAKPIDKNDLIRTFNKWFAA
jgi:signal transduction histidine kinase